MTAREPGRWRPVFRRTSSAVLALAGLAAAGRGPVASAVEVLEEDPATGEEAKRAGEGDSVSLKEALERVAKDYVSVVVFYDGGEGYESKPEDIPSRWLSYLDHRSFRRTVQRHALARLTDRDLDRAYPGRVPGAKKPGAADKPGGPGPDKPPKKPGGEGRDARRSDEKAERSGARVLGVTRGFPTLVLLDFRQRIVKRYTRKLPSRSALDAALNDLARKNRQMAVAARRVEKVLEGSRYAYKLGDRRSAVLKILPVVKPETLRKLDAITKKEVQDTQEVYRKEARGILRKASELEAARKYAMALEVLEGVARDYPFPDVVREASASRGRVYRKAQMGI